MIAKKHVYDCLVELHTASAFEREKANITPTETTTRTKRDAERFLLREPLRCCKNYQHKNGYKVICFVWRILCGPQAMGLELTYVPQLTSSVQEQVRQSDNSLVHES